MEALQASALPLGYATVNKEALYTKARDDVKSFSKEL
jgi:hypothetical protein